MPNVEEAPARLSMHELANQQGKDRLAGAMAFSRDATRLLRQVVVRVVHLQSCALPLDALAERGKLILEERDVDRRRDGPQSMLPLDPVQEALLLGMTLASVRPVGEQAPVDVVVHARVIGTPGAESEPDLLHSSDYCSPRLKKACFRCLTP